MTDDQQRLLLAERDLLRREVESLTQQVKLVVRAEHALTRSRRVVDRQLARIRRLADFALNIAGSEAFADISDQARGALLDFFELDDAVAVYCSAAEPELPADLCVEGPSVVAADAPRAASVLSFLSRIGAGPAAHLPPRVLVWVPLRARGNELVALLVGWTSRTSAHHRDLPRPEHLPFLELFGSHMTRALDNAALKAELRQKNQQLSASLADLERTQTQLVQAQKLEALGRLAGGIAHDFNNLLTLIVGAADSLRPAIGDAPEAVEDLEAILGATKRASGITRRLLAFGRQQEHNVELVDLNALITDLSLMLRRLLGDEVTLKLDLAPALPAVSADPVQIEQVIMNLAINARDAMPEGGTVTLETREQRPGQSGGRGMVALRVIDTGTGIDEAVVKQLFEPFFTTKPIGKGTGLGLATVYGIVQQNDGRIGVESTPGRGATFTVALPIGGSVSPPEEVLSADAPRGAILLVEDEGGIRRLAARVLRRAGFEVHEARDGLEALELERRLPRLELVVTDVVMPGLGGPELLRRLRETRPGLPVIFMSGHTFDNLDKGTLDPDTDGFLAKPFVPDGLRAAVERMLQNVAKRTQRAQAPPA